MKDSQTTFDRVVSAAFALSAVVVAAAVVTLAVRREFFPPAPGPTARSTEPVPVNNWEELIASGHSVGPPDASATVLVFADFECPACRELALGPLREIRERHGEEVRVIHRHWPLPYHRFAYPAARASECAAAQDRFQAYHDLLYEKQDSLGLKSFSEFAVESEVPDIPAFEECNARSERLGVISADSAAVRSIGGTGTPTVVVNGLRLPDARLLESIVEEAVTGATGMPASEPDALSPTVTPWESVPETMLEPELRIDGASAGLTRVGTIALAADGSVALSQPETGKLLVFDAQGRRTSEFDLGGIGAMARIGWLADTVWAFDVFQKELFFGTFPDRVVRRRPLPQDALRDPSNAEGLPEAFTRIDPLVLFSDGSIYARAIVSEETPDLSPSISSTVSRYVRMNPEGRVNRLVAEARGPPYVQMRTTGGSTSVRVPFGSGDMHEASPNGGFVATGAGRITGAHGGTWELLLQATPGDTIYSRAYPFDGMPIPRALADSVREARAQAMGSRTMARYFREQVEIPPVYAPLYSLAVSDDGTVWVGMRAVEGKRAHLILDPAGVPRGLVTLPQSSRVVAADGPRVWIVESSPHGVDSLIRYRILH